MEDALWTQRLRRKSDLKRNRYEFQTDHGLRKWFKTRCELSGMKSISNEKLLSTLIKDYLFTIKLNSDKNLFKERNLVNSEKWFKWLLVSIIITIVLILISKIF
jgi:hypothetical protein